MKYLGPVAAVLDSAIAAWLICRDDPVRKSARIDQSIRLIWRQTSVVVRYLAIWQTLQCLGLALEIWEDDPVRTAAARIFDNKLFE